MVGVIKSKGTQEITRSAGVLQINTGADQVAAALTRAADTVGRVAYKEFEIEQTELGKQTAKNFIPERDANGNLVYTDPSEGMTRVARNAATPIIEETYARQLGIDFDRSLLKLRDDFNAHQNDPAKFSELAAIKLEGIMNTIPEGFARVGQGVLNNVGATRVQEHVNQLTRAKINDERDAAIANMVIEVGDDTKTVVALLQAGDMDTAKDVAEAGRQKAKLIRGMGGTLQQERALIRDINTAIHRETMNMTATAMINDGEHDLLEDLQMAYTTGKIVEPDKPVVIGGKTMTVREALARRGVTDESLAAIDDIEVRAAVASRARTIANQYSGRSADMAKRTALMSEFQNQLNGALFAGSGSKTESDMQSVFTINGLDEATIIGPQGVAQAQNPETPLGKFLRNGQVFPSGIAKALTNVASGTRTDSNELRNLLTLWGTGSMGMTKNGPVVNSKLPDSVNAFWANVNNYAMSYGIEAANEYATSLTEGSTIGEDLENAARTRLGNSNKDAYAQIKQRWVDEGVIENLNPSAFRRLETIAKRAYASLAPDEADEYINTAYETLYAKTSVIITPSIMGAQLQDRSEFAPERFYPQGELYDQFEQMAHKKIRTAGAFYELGTNAYLYPSPDSTNSSVTWQVLDKQGRPITNSNGAIYIRSQTINKNQDMATKFGEAMAEKIAKAQGLRIKNIELDQILNTKNAPTLAEIRAENKRRKSLE